ncbi:tripartite tricarboxylate transporter substrate binding protein BugE [soil metagenome]
MQRRQWSALAAAAALIVVAGPVFAQAYPNKPIELSVPFAPGGTTDIVARVVGDPLGKVLGQPVIVVNRAGGGGIVGAAETARAAPDGYKLGIATVSSTAANPAINPKTPYDPVNDFTQIINIAATPNIIAVNPNFPARNYAEFIAELKKNPGKYSYSSSGTGGIGHLLMELYKSLTGTFVTHIPYRGAGPALNDTVAGQVPMIFDNLPSALPFIKAGKLIPIVVSAPNRVAALPNVPTFKEVGLEPVNRMAYYGILGPKGLPKDVVDKVNEGVKKALADPAVRKRIEDTDSIIVANTPEQFAAQIKAEFEIYKEVVAKQKLQLD